LTTLAAYQRRVGRERVQIDFEHATVPGTPEYDRTQEPRPVAGFAAVALSPDNAIVLDAIHWTTLGVANAEHFEDVSPVVVHTKDGEVVGIHSAALVRCGAAYGLTLLAAPDAEETETETTPEEKTMDPEAIKAAIAEALAPMQARLEALEKKLGEGAAKAEVDKTELSAAIDGALGPIRVDFARLSAENVAREKEHLVRLAMIDGKNVRTLTPETVTALSVDQLKAQLDALTSGEVPLTQQTRTTALSAAGAGGAAGGATEQQRAVARSLGLDPAKVEWK
jgi:hypothetical protein